MKMGQLIDADIRSTLTLDVGVNQHNYGLALTEVLKLSWIHNHRVDKILQPYLFLE